MDEEVTGKAIGGKARAEKLSPERKREIAQNAAKARWENPQPPKEKPPTTEGLGFLTYDNDGEFTTFRFDESNQIIWATTQGLAQLFNVDVSTIKKHIASIYKDEELQEVGTSALFTLVQAEGGRAIKREVLHYNLDVIISVGYRVSAKKAVKFRQWATQTLKAYVEQGYVINEKALRDSPEKLNKLAADIRAIRATEQQVYAKVRECFKVSSSDYDPGSAEVKKFYAILQDKFHHAVTSMTSSKLILDRANHADENMGMHSFKGDIPTTQEATTGKNYLREDELYRLHLLSEQFLLYAESTALAGRKMTMKSLHDQLDRLLTLNEYPVFDGYKNYIKKEAEDHAKKELALYKKRKKIESMGIEYDEEALSIGEYDDLLLEELLD